MNEQAPNHAPASKSGIAARALGASRLPVCDADTLSYLGGLNPEQKDAVLTTEGPAAGIGRCRYRQNPRVNHPYYPYSTAETGLAQPNSCGNIYQQSRSVK